MSNTSLASIKDLVSDVHVGRTPHSDRGAHRGGIPFVRTGDLNGETITDARRHISPEVFDATVVPENSVLVALQPVPGKVSVAKNRVAISQDLLGLECKERVQPLFLAYAIRAHRLELKRYIRGRIPRISKSDFLSLELPIPTLARQDHLLGAMSLLGLIQRDRQAALDKVNQYPQSCYQDLLRAYEDKYGVVPKQKVGDLASLRRGRSVDQEPVAADSETPAVRHVNANNISASGIIVPDALPEVDMFQEDVQEHRIKNNEVVLVSRGQAAGKAGAPFSFSEPVVGNTTFHIITADTVQVQPSYLVQALLSHNVQSQLSRETSSSTSSYLRLSRLSEISLPVVPMEWQKRLSDRLRSLPELLRDQLHFINELDTLRDSLLRQFRKGSDYL